MEVVEKETREIYSITVHGNRLEEPMLCPACSHTRKKKSEKCMSWNNQKRIGYCNHCGAAFYPHEEKEIDHEPIPWSNTTQLSDKWVRYFEGRRISQATLTKMQIAEKGKWIQFPFFKNDEVINIKSRDIDKNFRLESGKPLLFYNYDAIFSHKAIIITEGEIDTLSFIECGFDNVISVPNGANTGKMDYLEDALSDLEELDCIYLAVDQDSKGLELRNELQRRLGLDKCLIVDFGAYKDANEYLVNEGGVKFSQLLDNVKEPTIEGVVCAEDFYDEIKSLMENGIQPGKSIGLPELDELITWETRRLAICTGIPSHGKSEFVDFLTVRLFQHHGWKTAYFTPENYPLQFHYSKLYSKITKKAFNLHEYDAVTFSKTFEVIDRNFYWIDPEEDITIEAIIERAKFLVKYKGIKVLVIDPFNKLEHNYGKNQSETQYISSFLDKLTTFAKKYDVLVFLVAHPIKMAKQKDGTYMVPGLYDISGSANFYNKADYGLTVYRPFDHENNRLGNDVQIYVKKVKFKHLGSSGAVELKYNYQTGEYF